MRKTLDDLHMLKHEIETHKAKGRKRTLCKEDQEFFNAVERAIESFLGHEGPKNRIEGLYYFWSKQ